jgi:hypothetical protein
LWIFAVAVERVEIFLDRFFAGERVPGFDDPALVLLDRPDVRGLEQLEGL